MITVSEAKEIIRSSVKPLPPVLLNLKEAAGKVLAATILAGLDIPPFPQCAVDGYAFSFSDWQHGLKVEGELQAGSEKKMVLKSGQAIRIFTGAPMPEGADTVVMQEFTQLQNNILTIDDSKLKQGSNVRPQGSEIRAGEIALAKETLLVPGAIGFLAGIGVNEVEVYPNPVVSVIITGKELQQPGNKLKSGQIYESNSFALSAAFSQLNMPVTVFYLEDDLQSLTNTLQTALQESDLVLLTGGVSVGDYDFVLQAAENCEVKKLFHKVAQRPGKPLYFGMQDEKPVFGLPGNPASVLTCFYQYVLPALEWMTKQKLQLPTLIVPLEKSVAKAHPLRHFLKGYYNGKTVLSLEAQESYRLRSFASCNCLIQLNEEVREKKEGERVKIYLLNI